MKRKLDCNAECGGKDWGAVERAIKAAKQSKDRPWMEIVSNHTHSWTHPNGNDPEPAVHPHETKK